MLICLLKNIIFIENKKKKKINLNKFKIHKEVIRKNLLNIRPLDQDFHINLNDFFLLFFLFF